MSDEALRSEIREAISTHFENDHFAIDKQLAQNKKVLGYMLVAIQGVPDTDMLGNPNGQYIGGMENDIKEFKEQANGGGGFSVRTSSKLATAFITTTMIAVAQIAVAFIGRL